MRSNCRFMKLGTDLKYLWFEQMSEVRENWYLYLLFSVFLPVMLVFGFTHMGSGLTDHTSLLYIISGAMTFSIASDALYGTAMRIGEMRVEGSLVYYVTLPIHFSAFILAFMLSRLMITLPGMVAPIAVGVLFYHLELQPHVILLLVLPLSAFCFTTIGLVIGTLINDIALIQMVVNALLFVLVMLAPVFIPLSSLPVPLQAVAYLLPMTHAAAVLRAGLMGEVGWSVVPHISLLVGTIGLSLIFVRRHRIAGL